MTADWLLPSCCLPARQGGETHQSHFTEASLCRQGCGQRRCADVVRGDVVHRSRVHALPSCTTYSTALVDPVAFAPKCGTALESKGCQPCRKKRHDRCCFEIAPRRFRIWQAIYSRRDRAIGNLPPPMSNSPTRRSAVRRSTRPQSPHPRWPTLSSQDRLGVNAAELVPRFRSS